MDFVLDSKRAATNAFNNQQQSWKIKNGSNNITRIIQHRAMEKAIQQ